MSVEITAVNGAGLIPDTFMRRWAFDRRSEMPNAKKAAALTSKKQARLHTLSIDSQDYGFVAVDIHKFPNEKQHLFQVLFLFVSAPYRKTPIDDLDGMSASEYLMAHVMAQSLEAAKFFPVKALILQPASDKLIPLYRNLGFTELPGVVNWMTLPLVV